MINETKKPETVETWNDAEKMIAEKLLSQNETFAQSVIDQAKASAKKWFIAFLIVLSAFVSTNVYWIYVLNSYEYVYQDGEGQNNYNKDIEGDVDNFTTD